MPFGIEPFEAGYKPTKAEKKASVKGWMRLNASGQRISKAQYASSKGVAIAVITPRIAATGSGYRGLAREHPRTPVCPREGLLELRRDPDQQVFASVRRDQLDPEG